MIYIRSCLLGILISLSTSYIILTLSLLSDHADISSKELMQQLVIAIVMGIVIGLATTIYFLDKFSLTIATIIHFSIVTVVVLVAGTVGQWFSWHQPSSIIGVFISEVIAYIIIWIVIHILTKQEVEQLNQLIQERRLRDEQYRGN